MSVGSAGGVPLDSDDVHPAEGSRWLADLIDERCEALLDDYENALTGLGNAIVTDPESLRQARENARQILIDVSASLRAGEVRVGEAYRFIAWNIGMARAADGVHPSESLPASSTSFSTLP